jgi:3-hydroxybutyryl-CoA dehydratase
MKEYKWSDLYIGMKHEFVATFSAEDATSFATISGDHNPLHTDAQYAQAAGFQEAVLFGMMTSSLYSQLVGVHLPGKYALLQGIDIDFNAPAFAGEALTVAGEIVFMNEAYRRFEIKATIRNPSRKLVSKAIIRVGFHVS